MFNFVIQGWSYKRVIYYRIDEGNYNRKENKFGV